MKIYERVVIDIESGLVIEEDWVQYDGSVVFCKGPQPPALPKPMAPPPLPPPPKMEEAEEKVRADYFKQMLEQMRKGKAATLIGSGQGITTPALLGKPTMTGERKTVLGG